MTIKADLHYHGLIGFHEPWLSLQGMTETPTLNTKRTKSLIGHIFQAAEERNIDLVAITSESDCSLIPKGSCHDRFGYLSREAEELQESNWTYHKLGSKAIAFLIERKSTGKKLIIVNGQTIIAKIGTPRGMQRYDHLVIGSNQIPNGLNLEETITRANDLGLVQIAEHPFYDEHYGIGQELLEKHLADYDAIEGHNSQLRWGNLAKTLLTAPLHIPQLKPIVKQLLSANRDCNKKAQEYAEKKEKPWIATSDGHTIMDLGISYIEFPSALVSQTNGERLLETLKTTIRSNRFETHCTYENPLMWLTWAGIFQYGLIKEARK